MSFLKRYFRQRSANSFWGTVVALSAFVLALLFTRFLGRFEFDPDESNNLMKSLLLDQGFSLGKDIWTDQPPLYSYLLYGAFKLFGSSVALGRLLTLGFSSLLLFFLYDSLRLAAGHRHALAASGLLVTSTHYVPLSVSVMIGLPSLTLSAGALWCIVHALDELRRRTGESATQTRRVKGLFLGAGTLLGLSLGTKLFTLFLVPLFGLVLLASSFFYERPRSFRTLQAPLLGALGLGLSLLVCFFPLLRARTLSGLIEAHATSREASAGALDGARSVLSFVEADVALFALATLSLPLALLVRKRKVLLYLGWLLFALVALADHYPIWPHHRLLLTIPAAALAGFSMGELVRGLLRVTRLEQPNAAPTRRWVSAAVIGVLIGLGSLAPGFFAKERLSEMGSPRTWADDKVDWAIYSEFAPYARRARFTAAARPMFSFRAGRPVPPNLAVTSWKRFRTRLLSVKAVERSIEKFSPEVVLLSNRWPKEVQRRVRERLHDTHSLVKSWRYQNTELWVHTSLSGLPAGEQAQAREKRRRPHSSGK